MTVVRRRARRARNASGRPAGPAVRPGSADGQADQVLRGVEGDRVDAGTHGQRLVREAVQLVVALVEREDRRAGPAGVRYPFQQRVRGRVRAHDQQGL